MAERKVRGLRPSHVKCRAWSHDWDFGQTSSNGRAVPADGFHEVCRCTRCGSERVTWLGWDGHPIARWYEYPDEYAEVSGMTRAEARLWLHKGA